MGKSGLVLRDILGKIPDQPVSESLSIRARLSTGAILDLALKKGGTVLEIRHLPGTGQGIGYHDLAVLPLVSNVVRIKTITNVSREGAQIDG